jgi:biopolymer transport protein ExbD
MALQVKKEEPEIPTASMADIAFLLIVFFMLTTVFSANKGIEHVLPQNEPPEEEQKPEEAIYIHIFVENTFDMDGKSYSMDQAREVYEYVYGKVQQNATKPVIIHTNPQAPYGSMIAILDQIKMVEVDIGRPVSLTIPTKDEAEMYNLYGVQ